MADRPNPGSSEAAAAGCLCPTVENNHGQSAPFDSGEWWIIDGCPVHPAGADTVDYRRFGEPVTGGCGRCGHEQARHKPKMAGICIGCPCDTWTAPFPSAGLKSG